MGKLIRAGWDFRLNNQNLEATIPSGHQVKLNLNSQDVLMMPHETRTGEDAFPLTGAPTSMNTIDPDTEEPKPESNLTGTGYTTVSSMLSKKMAEYHRPSPMFFEAFRNWPAGPSWRARHKESYNPKTGRHVLDEKYVIDDGQL